MPRRKNLTNKINERDKKSEEEINEEEKENEEEEIEEEEEEIEEEEHIHEKQELVLNKKCSLKEHEEIDAIKHCQECNINVCNKCEKVHFELFKNHHLYNLDNDIENIFTGFCKEYKHQFFELEYFCENHNQLCCAACIAKIKGKGNGKHNNCKLIFVENVSKKKKANLSDNIKYLEKLSKTIEPSINELKKIFEQTNKKKEDLKLKIRVIFTKIRNALNEREDELLLEVDKEYDNLFFKEELIKESEKIPSLIKNSLDKSSIVEKDWGEKQKLKSLINYCITIENNINCMKKINEKLENSKLSAGIEVKFSSEEIITIYGEVYQVIDFIPHVIKKLKSYLQIDKFCHIR